MTRDLVSVSVLVIYWNVANVALVYLCVTVGDSADILMLDLGRIQYHMYYRRPVSIVV